MLVPVGVKVCGVPAVKDMFPVVYTLVDPFLLTVVRTVVLTPHCMVNLINSQSSGIITCPYICRLLVST